MYGCQSAEEDSLLDTRVMSVAPESSPDLNFCAFSAVQIAQTLEQRHLEI